MTETERKSLRNQSARALLATSVMLMLPALVVISPSGRIGFLVIATIFAGISTLLCQGRTRIFAIIAMVVMLLLTVASYPAYKKHMDHYMDRIQEKSVTESAPNSTDD